MTSFDRKRCTRQVKFDKIKQSLIDLIDSGTYALKLKKDEEIYKLNRLQIKTAIKNALNIGGTHSVNGWINDCLDQKIIFPNPHSQLSAKKRFIKPTNDSLYFVNKEYLMISLRQTHTQSKLFK